MFFWWWWLLPQWLVVVTTMYRSQRIIPRATGSIWLAEALLRWLEWCILVNLASWWWEIDKCETGYMEYNVPDCFDGATMNARRGSTVHSTCSSTAERWWENGFVKKRFPPALYYKAKHQQPTSKGKRFKYKNKDKRCWELSHKYTCD